MKQGWESKKLGDVCDIVNGGTPKTSISEYWNGDNLWITPKDMGKLDSIYVEDTSRKITDEGIQNSSAKLFSAYSIILSSRAPIGHLAINKKPISTNQGCKGIVPSDEINYLYLYYFLKNSVKLLNSLGSGTTFKELSSGKLKNVIIPIPPLEEQKQIVNKLDQCFEAIDKAKANAAKNLENAKELFQSRLNDIFSQKGEGWVEKKLGDLCKTITKGTTPTSVGFEFIDEGVNFIKVESIRRSGEFIPSKFAHISNDCNNALKRSQLIEGDILFSIAGALGRTAIVTSDVVPANTNQALSIIRLKESANINKNYLYLLLNSGFVIEQIEKHRGGTAQQNLSLGQMKDFLIPMPDLSEQKRIYIELSKIRKQTQSLESKYQQELNSLEELKKSILQKAFEGEL